MTSTGSKPTNLKEIYFKHAALTPISGNPKYDDLQSMYCQCKANVQSVPSILGGGAHGHLSLIISANAYNTVAPGNPYTRPTNPGPLVQPTPAPTAAQMAENIRNHQELIRIFQEANQIKSTIQNQIAVALDDTVMSPYVNTETGTVEGTDRDTMQYLFKTYGNISSSTTLITTKHNLSNHVYVHEDPIVVIFNKIHKYEAMAETQGAPETDKQLINMGIIIIMNAKWTIRWIG